MKNRTFNIKILTCAFALILSLVGLVFATAFSGKNSADADFIDYPLYLPVTDAENYALLSPQEAVSLNGKNYVIKYDEVLHQNVLLLPNGTTRTEFSSLNQLRVLDDNNLLVGDNGSIYVYDITSLSSKLPVKDSELKQNIGSIFDYNGTYLLTCDATKLHTYTLTGTTAKLIGNAITCHNNTPVAINANNEIFYVNPDRQLYKNNIQNTAPVLLASDVTCTKIIANNDFVYFTTGTEIYRITLSDNSLTKLTVSGDDRFDLGKIVNPVGISFKGDNLFITDNALAAVSEFKIEGDNLIFTGYAIANGKTAYNRIGKENVDIDRYKDTVAVLDTNKLTIFTDTDKTDYSPEKFINLFVGNAPSLFALGDKTLITYDGTFVKVFDFTGKELVNVDFDGYVKDVCYQSGYFYVLSAVANDSVVYRVDEKTLEHSTFKRYGDKAYTVFNVDVLGKITLYPLADGILKLTSDLNGNLYALKNDGIYSITNNKLTKLSLPFGGVSSFALNFDKKEIYIIRDDVEKVYVTTALTNHAVNAINVPTDFMQYNTPVKQLEVYTVNENANLYDVGYESSTFNFNDLVKANGEYVKVGESGNFYFLVSHRGVYLVNKADAVNKPVTFTPQDKVAYVATSVRLYNLPVITADNAFVQDLPNGKLEKGTRFDVLKSVTIIDQEFYYVGLTLNGQTYIGYIPVSFTTNVLSEDFEMTEFKLKNEITGIVYTASDLTEVFYSITNQTVKLYDIKDGVALVEVEIDGVWELGYMDAKLFESSAATTVRNVLIVLAAIGCICGSTTYFILRKKGKDY